MSNGYFALKTEILGADRVLDVHFDAAPAEPGNDYAGYLCVNRVLFNGVDITPALSKSDLETIGEDVLASIEHEKNKQGEFA